LAIETILQAYNVLPSALRIERGSTKREKKQVFAPLARRKEQRLLGSFIFMVA